MRILRIRSAYPSGENTSLVVVFGGHLGGAQVGVHVSARLEQHVTGFEQRGEVGADGGPVDAVLAMLARELPDDDAFVVEEYLVGRDCGGVGDYV